MKSGVKSESHKGILPFFYGWIIVAASFCVATIAYAVHYSFGVFFKPLVADLGWTETWARTMISGAFALYNISRGGFGILTGWATDKYGPRVTVIAGGFFICAGLLLTSQISAIWQLYLFYGLIVGLGVSIAFAPLTATASRWFSKRRGLAVGIVVAGVGLGTTIMPRPAAYFISTYGWQTSYILMGLSSFIIIGLASLLLRHNPQELGLLPNGKAEGSNPKKVIKESSLPDKGEELSLAEAIRARPFWVLFLMTTLFGTCLYLVMVHLIPHATDIGIPLPVAANFMVVIGISTIVGRLAMGALADRIGTKLTLAICLIIETIAVFWFLGMKDVRMFYGFAAIFGFAYGGCVAQLPLLAAGEFGLRSTGTIIGVEMLGASIGGAIGPLLGGVVFDLTRSYSLAFLAGAVGLLITTSLIPFIKTIKKEKILIKTKQSNQYRRLGMRK